MEREHLDRAAQIARYMHRPNFIENGQVKDTRLSILLGTIDALLHQHGLLSHVLPSCLARDSLACAQYDVLPDGQLKLLHAAGFPKAATGEVRQALGCSAHTLSLASHPALSLQDCRFDAQSVLAASQIASAAFIPLRAAQNGAMTGALLLAAMDDSTREEELLMLADAIAADVCKAHALMALFARERAVASGARS